MFVVWLFEEVTQDYGAAPERVNAGFGTRFSTFDHSDDNVNEVFARMEKMHRARRGEVVDEKQISHPSTVKAGLKEAMRKELKAPDARSADRGSRGDTRRPRCLQLRPIGGRSTFLEPAEGAVRAKRPGLPPAVKRSWAGLATPARVSYNPLLVGVRRRGN